MRALEVNGPTYQVAEGEELTIGGLYRVSVAPSGHKRFGVTVLPVVSEEAPRRRGNPLADRVKTVAEREPKA